MSETVIQVENLSKKYVIGHQQIGAYRYKALRDVLTDGIRSLGRKLKQPNKIAISSNHEEFWALKDVSFEVKQGDRIGIIGRNGAGKSTLLKLLSRITEPTTGRIRLRGRVASLLEVGTGFHPELTGRENIFLNGAILGMSRAEISRKFDEMVEFAEIARFLDTPVKRYSSGMYVRLAFAVAAHLESEILVVDEVLAVGDAAFQKKCLGKMSDVASSEGRTVFFVSHNTNSIQRLCNTGILLKKGEIHQKGNINEVIKNYIDSYGETQQAYEIETPRNKQILGYAYKLVVEDQAGNPSISLPMGKPWQLRILFRLQENVSNFMLAVGFLTDDNFPIRTCWSQSRNFKKGNYEAVFREETLIFSPVRQRIVIGLSENKRTFHYVENAGFLEIGDFSNDLNLPQTANVGLLLNSMQVEIRGL